MRAEEKEMDRGHSLEDGAGLEIAIVGMAARFPGAENILEFWRNLRDGVESYRQLTAEELSAIPAARRRSPVFVPVTRTIPNYDQFDAGFFGVSPREAEVLDPQHRLFLECCWSAFEHAGYDPERLPGPTGVYAGSRMNMYLWNVYSNSAVIRTVGELQAQIANEKDYVATRVSYKLNLGGPSVTVQSACSTSLVAVHLACQGLLSGECDMALAGGVAIRIPENGYLANDGGINSPDGHVRAFDARAAGTLFTSGLGVVILRRLADAAREGDTIHAVIRGSAVTNDGSHKVGFTAPGVDGQMRVIRTALAVAEVEPDQISYIEAHGTGTPVGDPIEVMALTKAFREKTDRRGFCALGTVKSNIGHLGVAAGVAGLIKTVLALKHRMIPPSLLFERPNPQIDFDNSPFFVNTQLREWRANGMPRRAGVSAFGMGGTNAHVIVEEAPEPTPASPCRAWKLLLLAARTETALARLTSALASHLEGNPQDDLADVAYTLQVGRKEHEHRRAVVCRDREQALKGLKELGPECVSTGFVAGRQRRTAFLFSGQGSQYVGMGNGLYLGEATFRAQVDACCELLRPALGLDLREVMFAAEEDAEAAERLGQTRFTQPALFVVEYALARQWMQWGIVPQAMLGHSIGEYVAACLAGVMSLDAALALVAERGRLMQSLPSGAMLAVPLSEAQVTPLLTAELSLAAINAPDRCVISGPHEAVEELRARLAACGVGARRLHTSHAFHSAMMEPILAPFLHRFTGIELAAPRIPYVSNLTGTWITPAEAVDPAYWARHLRQAVRFADGIRELSRDPNLVLLEVGPGQTLATLARQHPERGRDRVVLTSLRHPKDRQEDLPAMLKALGQLWLAGVRPDWKGFYARERRRRTPLPTYPFERRRFWVEEGDSVGGLMDAKAAEGKKGDIADWFYLPYWKPALPPTAISDEDGDRWLVFADAAGLAERIVGRLTARGRTVVTVAAGAAFRRLGVNRFEIKAGQRADYDALIGELKASGTLPDRILHLWNVGPLPMDVVTLTSAPDLSFWSLLYLAQSFGRHDITQRMHLAVVTSHMQRVGVEDQVLPERALLLGPSKIIPKEYPKVQCVSVDIDMPATDAMLDRLIAETEAAPPETVVAYRKGRRWIQTYEAVRLEASAATSLQLRQRGVYLITGGLGGLGLTFAEFLARELQARLVLVGASALPDRAEWDDWLRSHDESDRTSQKLRKVREIETMGAEVIVVSADVADRERMRDVVAETQARFGTVNGVIHAAGVPGGGMIQLKTAEMADRVMSPKVAGTRALMDALAGIPVEFVVLCSSTIAVAGGLGQVDYCAANNFLDAYAQAMDHAAGPRTLSINWGAWEEVGMAVSAGLMPVRPAVTGQRQAVAESPHPLLDRCMSLAVDRAVYETDFDPSRHWMLDEHRILGTPALPGTTHLELARAAFLHFNAASGLSPVSGVELRDVYFLSPLTLPEGRRTARVSLEREADALTFQVASRPEPPTGRGDTAWQAHARGRVVPLDASPFRERYDISELLSRCGERELEITGPAIATGENLVWWGPHWQSLKRIHLGSGEGLARLELPDDFAAETEIYGLHPALLDVATGIASATEGVGYLPLSYRRVRVYRDLPAKLFSYLRRHGEANKSSEILAVDIVLLSEDGEVLVEIDHFTMKRVGEAAGTLKRGADVPLEANRAVESGEPVSVKAAVDDSDGILPQEGVEALRRVLSRDFDRPQVVVTAKDLHALIARVSAIDRASLADAAGAGRPQAAVHARPSISTPFAAPVTESEKRLAAVWQVTLGIEQVGINDNFFDLGGDSILGIQIVARAAEAGLQLSPDQLFEHQTVAELAKLFESAPEQETVAAGPLPVTSFQRDLLEAGESAPCWYSVWPLPPTPAVEVDREIVGRALAEIVARHEALCTRFARTPEGWTQAVGPADRPGVRDLDLSMSSWTDYETGVAALAQELGKSLDPERGVLLTAGVLAEGKTSPRQVLLTAHPVVVDGPSWSLLREELRTACRQLASREPLSLPPVAASFLRWLDLGAERDRMQGLPSSAGAWLRSWETAALPVVDPASWSPGSPVSGAVTVRLGAEETRALLNDVPGLKRVRVEEAILAALARTLARTGSRRSALLQAVVDGRGAEALDLNLTGTVGCFAVRLPVLLDLGNSGDMAEELRLVKEQCRAAAAGARCVLFADLSGDTLILSRLAALPATEVSFSYLSDAQMIAGPTPTLPLDVVARLDGEGLRFDWTASEGSRYAGAMAAMAGEFLEALRSLIEFCLSTTVALYTPSDFPDADLSQEELDKLFS